MTSLMMSPEGDNSDVRVATVMSLVAIFGKSDSSTHSSNAQESERLQKPPWLQAGERGKMHPHTDAHVSDLLHRHRSV